MYHRNHESTFENGFFSEWVQHVGLLTTANHLHYILSQHVADSDDRNRKRIYELQLLHWLDQQ